MRISFAVPGQRDPALVLVCARHYAMHSPFMGAHAIEAQGGRHCDYCDDNDHDERRAGCMPAWAGADVTNIHGGRE